MNQALEQSSFKNTVKEMLTTTSQRSKYFRRIYVCGALVSLVCDNYNSGRLALLEDRKKFTIQDEYTVVKCAIVTNFFENSITSLFWPVSLWSNYQ